MRVQLKRILQIFQDSDGYQKDFYTDDALADTITDACNVYSAGRFIAISGRPNVSLAFAGVPTVVGWYVEASAPYQLIITDLNGGQATLHYEPPSNGALAIASNDAPIQSLVVVPDVGLTVQGRYVVYGMAPTA